MMAAGVFGGALMAFQVSDMNPGTPASIRVGMSGRASSLCSVAIPFVSDLRVVVGLLLVRALLSQMDVPARQSYVMAVVTPPERPAAASVTAVPRSLASSLSPPLAGLLLSSTFLGLPLILCGALKIAYDVGLLFSFRHIKPPEERLSRG